MTKPNRLDQYLILGNSFIELADYVESGLSVKQSLELLCRDTQSGRIKRLLKKVSHQMEHKPKFSDALGAGLPRIPDAIVKVIEHHESDDRLEYGLRKVGEYLSDIKSLSGTYLPYGSLVYAAFLGFVAVLVLTIMMIYVVPQYEALYQEFSTPLPAITQGLINSPHLFLSYWWMVIILGPTLLYIFKVLHFTTPIPGSVVHGISRSIPWFAHKARMRQDVRLLHTLRLLSHLDPPWESVLSLLESLTGSGFTRNLMAQARHKWLNNGELLTVLLETTLYSEKTLAIAGQFDAGRVSEDLLRELVYRRHNEFASGVLGLSWIRPLMTLVMALLIGYIAIAMYLPLFQVGSLF